jgi:hypothetical protein
MTWEEFTGLTLAQLEALEERRSIKIRHARFNAALMTAAIFNVHRSAETEALTPFDFLPGFERDPEEAEREFRRRAARKGLQVAMARLPNNTAPEMVRELKDKMIARLKASGFEDAEEIWAEAFANG